jgi:acetyl-CoA decarbonylase/synthase complex subunit gamma
MKKKYVTGVVDTPAGKVEQVSATWSRADVMQTIKVRWSFGRMNYRVKQGLYAVGNPGSESDVFVTANFKLSFDHLRRSLGGLDAWILVLDTKGINVWCAAGKGTFGTKEITFRIKAHELHKIVSHRQVIVPQLGAPGISAHEVKEKTGFKVIYGPVRSNDIKNFIQNGYRATPEMRRVNFTLWDRLKLIPVELAYGKYYLLLIPAVFFILSGLNSHGFSVDTAWHNGGRAVVNLFAAYVSGCVITPVLLPWIPFKRFSLKGLTAGWLISILFFYWGFLGGNIFEAVSWLLIIGGVSSFIAMNFTGSSTFTSLSGVRKEMKLSLPVQIGFASAGFIGWFITRFI